MASQMLGRKIEDGPSWISYYHSELEKRNKMNTSNFSEMINKYTELLSQNKSLQDQKSLLEREKLASQAANITPEVRDLEEKITSLKTNLSETYKESKDQTLEVLELTKTLKDLEISNKENLIQLQATREMINQNESIIKSRNMKISEMESELEVIRAENTVLVSSKKKLEKEMTRLMGDNQNLVNSMMHMKEEQMKKLNEATELYEEARRMKKKYSQQAEMYEEEKGLPQAPEVNLSEYTTNLLQYNLKVKLPSNQKHKIFAHQNETTCVVYDPLGNKLATGGGDHLIKIWDPNSGKNTAILKGFQKAVTSLSFNLEGSVIAGGSVQKTVKLFSLKTHRELHTFTGHKDTVNAIKMMLRSPKIISGSADRSIKIWDCEKNLCSKTNMCYSSCFSMDTTNEDNLVVSGHLDGTLRLWSVITGQLVHQIKDLHDGLITSVSISNDNQYVLTNSQDNTLQYVDLRTYKVLKRFESEHYTNTSQTNKACLSAGAEYVLVGGKEKIIVFNTKTAEVEDVYEEAHTSRVLGCYWQPRGSQFASVDGLGGLIIWE